MLPLGMSAKTDRRQIALFPMPTISPPVVSDVSISNVFSGTVERAITLTQPWASLVALGEKLIETRSWSHKFRGPIAIHAAKKFPRECRDLCLREPMLSALHGESPNHLPTGCVVAVAQLTDCFKFVAGVSPFIGRVCATNEEKFGSYTPGRFGFVLSNVVRLPNPVFTPGALGLWVMNDEAQAAVAQQLHAKAKP